MSQHVELYIVIAYDEGDPYVYSDYNSRFACYDDALQSALEAQHETGDKCIVKTIHLQDVPPYMENVTHYQEV